MLILFFNPSSNRTSRLNRPASLGSSSNNVAPSTVRAGMGDKVVRLSGKALDAPATWDEYKNALIVALKAAGVTDPKQIKAKVAEQKYLWDIMPKS